MSASLLEARTRTATSNSTPLLTAKNSGLRILKGSRPSSDDDRAQDSPVRLAGVEQGSDPVVLEVAKSETDALDALDQVVEGLSWSVGHPGVVVIDDLVEPVVDLSLIHI